MKTKKLCKVCKKEFEYYVSKNPNRKFCSHNCMFKYFKKHKIGILNPENRMNDRKIGGLRAAITNKKNKTGFWDPKIQSMGGKKAAETNRKNKTSVYDPKVRKKGQSKGGKISAKIHKKNKTGIFNPKLRIKGGETQGPKTAKILREKKKIKFNGIYFASYKECEIGMCIHYQIEKLKEGKNYQKNIGKKLFDFFVFNTFIEFHPWDWQKRTPKKYYQERRKILNKNGYEDYPLIVIK